MASGGMIYVPSFINLGSRVQKLSGRDTHAHTHTHTHTHRSRRSHKPTSFFLKKKTRLKSQRGTVATVPQPKTYNYVNCHYFMALSHTFYVLRLQISQDFTHHVGTIGAPSRTVFCRGSNSKRWEVPNIARRNTKTTIFQEESGGFKATIGLNNNNDDDNNNNNNNDNSIQFNTYLFTCKLNSPEANYKVITSKK
jgi:hypothetical protein